MTTAASPTLPLRQRPTQRRDVTGDREHKTVDQAVRIRTATDFGLNPGFALIKQGK